MDALIATWLCLDISFNFFVKMLHARRFPSKYVYVKMSFSKFLAQPYSRGLLFFKKTEIYTTYMLWSLHSSFNFASNMVFFLISWFLNVFFNLKIFSNKFHGKTWPPSWPHSTPLNHDVNKHESTKSGKIFI